MERPQQGFSLFELINLYDVFVYSVTWFFDYLLAREEGKSNLNRYNKSTKKHNLIIQILITLPGWAPATVAT